MKKVRVALIQFDAKPEAIDENLGKMMDLIQRASGEGARWIVFHEGTTGDYTPRLTELAEPVPGGKSTQLMIQLAQKNDCFISFGLSEVEAGKFYISQVFVGPKGFIYRYRKTWLWRDQEDKGYRNEWERYDPGSGPEIFDFDGYRATCFICADGEAPRCIDRAKMLEPEVVFYPNNRYALPDYPVFGERAKAIGAPMLVTNRTGRSWVYDCVGGGVVYSGRGEVLANSDRDGREDILVFDLDL